MAILNKNEIFALISKGKIVIDPPIDQFQLQPAAIDLRVGYNFFTPKLWQVTERGRTEMGINHLNDNASNEILDQIHLKPGQVFELLPGEFILISTLEKIGMKNGQVMANLFPRSSTSRRGLSIEPGVVDPYYEGYLTLAVKNQTRTQTITIYPGERIAQLVFYKMEGELTEEESLIHGNSKPKYQGAKAYLLDYKFDHHDEIKLIQEGQVEQLKKRFSVQLDSKETKNGKENRTLPL